MESAFLCLEVQLVFSEPLKNLRNMVVMFVQAPGVDQDVINEHFVHKILEDGGSVDKSIRHNIVLVVASRCHKFGLPLVPLTYPDQIICTAEVQLGEDGGTTEMFQGRWDERKWVAELDGDLVQRKVINSGP